MMLTREELAQWRDNAERGITFKDARILALLDALDAAEERVERLIPLVDGWRDRCLNARMEREKASEALAETAAKVARVKALADEERLVSTSELRLALDTPATEGGDLAAIRRRHAGAETNEVDLVTGRRLTTEGGEGA